MVQTNTGCAKREHKHLPLFKAQVQSREQTSTITSSCIGIAMVDCLTYLGIGWNSNDRTLPLPKCHVHGISLKKSKCTHYTIWSTKQAMKTHPPTDDLPWFTNSSPPKKKTKISESTTHCAFIFNSCFFLFGFPQTHGINTMIYKQVSIAFHYYCPIWKMHSESQTETTKMLQLNVSKQTYVGCQPWLI